MPAYGFGLGAVLSASALLLLPPARALAHDESVSASEVVVGDREVLWRVDVGLAGLAKVIAFAHPPIAGELAARDEAEIAIHREAIAAYLGRGLEVFLDGQLTPARVGAVKPVYETLPTGGPPRITRVSLELGFEAPRGIRELRARLGFFSDLTSTHRALLKIRWGAESRQMSRLGPSEVVLERGRLNPSVWTSVGDFVRWGALHIFIGYDHIAFLLALLLAVARFRQMLLIITSFTVAHSCTILLAALEIVRMPVRMTEALIAASIVWVALENLAFGLQPRPRRWALTFAFGLIHGLGFAEVLRERLAGEPGGILLPVIAFNLGVELGQAVLVAAAFPILVWLRRGPGSRLPPEAARIREEGILRFGSIPIALLGLIWLAQRLW
jgi:hydrogenase/urease accessory protein HupE